MINSFNQMSLAQKIIAPIAVAICLAPITMVTCITIGDKINDFHNEKHNLSNKFFDSAYSLGFQKGQKSPPAENFKEKYKAEYQQILTETDESKRILTENKTENKTGHSVSNFSDLVKLFQNCPLNSERTFKKYIKHMQLSYMNGYTDAFAYNNPQGVSILEIPETLAHDIKFKSKRFKSTTRRNAIFGGVFLGTALLASFIGYCSSTRLLLKAYTK